MRIPRLVAGVVSAALLGLVPVSLSAATSPAAAAAATKVDLKVSRTKATYGDSVYINGNALTPQDGEWRTVPVGGVSLQEVVPGGTWRTIGTDTSGGYFYFTVKARQNASYRVVYSGGSDSYWGSFNKADSATVTVRVTRKLTIRNPRKTVVKGKVSPSYKRSKVIVQKKVGRKWRKHRVVRTNKSSAFTLTLPAARKRTYFRFVIPGTKQYTSLTSSKYYTIKY